MLFCIDLLAVPQYINIFVCNSTVTPNKRKARSWGYGIVTEILPMPHQLLKKSPLRLLVCSEDQELHGSYTLSTVFEGMPEYEHASGAVKITYRHGDGAWVFATPSNTVLQTGSWSDRPRRSESARS